MQLQIYSDLHPFLAPGLHGNKRQLSSVRLRGGEKEERIGILYTDHLVWGPSPIQKGTASRAKLIWHFTVHSGCPCCLL